VEPTPPPPSDLAPPGDVAHLYDDTEPKRARSSVRSAVEWVVILAGALGLALIIKAFLLQAFYIPSPSMVPTLDVGDRVLVNKLSYHVHDIHRGDIVVFKRPPLEADVKIKDLIKRVVALPGETIEARDGHLLIDGRVLNEPYLSNEAKAAMSAVTLAPQKVPAGHYFVMGDNRGNSKDSRFFGPIAKKLIVGRAFIRVWPLSKINLL
jgi:signal peptidase I